MQVSNTALQDKLEWSERSIGELLLEPTVIYVRSVMKLAEEVTVKACTLSHCHPLSLRALWEMRKNLSQGRQQLERRHGYIQ